MKASTILLLFLVFFSGCDDEDEPTNSPGPGPEPELVTIFTLTIDMDYPFKRDNWVLVHDKDGVLLDYKQIDTGGVLEFQTSAAVPDRIGITIFKYDTIGNTDAYTFESYLAVPTGQEWIWQKPTTPPVVGPGTSVGTFTTNYTVPVPLRMDVFGNGSTLGGTSQTGNTKFYQSTIYENDKNFLLSIAGDGSPRYTFFEKVQNAEHFEVTFDEMEEYDKVLDISFPPTSDPYVKVYTIDDEGKAQYYTYLNTFNLPPFGPSETLTNLKIGYLNRFEKYYTSIQIPSPAFGFGYEKVGTSPAAINFPDHAEYEVTNETFENFSYSNEKPFTMRRSSFQDDAIPNRQIWWTLYAPEGTDRVKELPEAFIEIYHLIKLQNFEHRTTSFQNSSRSYLGYLGRIGNGTPESEEYETTTISVQ